MSKGRRIRPGVASPLLLLCIVASALVLSLARASDRVVFQVPAMFVSMVIVFFASHPLGHFFIARAYGVGTEYFFVGRSDFRKLPSNVFKLVGAMTPTIGTKLKKNELSKLPPRRRGYIFGAGVIVSNTLVGIELLYVLAAGFSLAAVLSGAVFFVVMLSTEFFFSTKAGDLRKMANEFEKPMPERGATNV